MGHKTHLSLRHRRTRSRYNQCARTKRARTSIGSHLFTAADRIRSDFVAECRNALRVRAPSKTDYARHRSSTNFAAALSNAAPRSARRSVAPKLVCPGESIVREGAGSFLPKPQHSLPPTELETALLLLPLLTGSLKQSHDRL